MAMIEDLQARFLPQFVALARTRLATCRAAVEGSDPAARVTMVRDLHTVAGEAGLLALTEAMELARAAEVLAKAGDPGLPAALERLALAIEALRPPG
jgi:HPt (histidine-containing phosphotransfer) domain-containing protein